MKLYNWNNFIKGWICGGFNPSIIHTNNVEIAIKRYKAGDYDLKHYHKKADEITMIIEGKVSMNKKEYKKDDILLIEKGETTDFLAISDTITCVIKIPYVKGDKYLIK